MRVKILRPAWAGLFFCLLLVFLDHALALAEADTSESDYLPTERYYSELLKTSPELQAYDAELNKVWKEFYASFSPADSPSSKRLALEWYRKCRIEGQKLLERYIGDKEAFIQKQLGQTQLIEYMRRVAALAKAPNADLQFMLAKMTPPLHHYEDPYWMSEALGQLALAAAGPEPTEESKNKVHATYGYYEEQRITYTYRYGQNGVKNALELNYNLYSTSISRFVMEAGAGGVFYGYNSGIAGNIGLTHEGIFGGLTMVKDGRISFLLIDRPAEEEFFLNPTNDELWAYPPQPEASDGGSFIYPCEMGVRYHPVKAGDFSEILAELYQANDLGYAVVWQCVPQCRIPYKLEGNVYKKQPPVCLPDAEWGVRPPEH